MGEGHLPKAEKDITPARSGREFGEGLLTARDIAPRLLIQPRTVAKWARQGRIPAYQIGRKLGFKWVEVEQSLQRVEAPNAISNIQNN
jgi:excisionase family DNA binding protein